MKIAFEKIQECVDEWYSKGGRKGTQQRLGQYLMNNLLPAEVNPSIFYEASRLKAMAKFINTYQL